MLLARVDQIEALNTGREEAGECGSAQRDPDGLHEPSRKGLLGQSKISYIEAAGAGGPEVISEVRI